MAESLRELKELFDLKDADLRTYSPLTLAYIGIMFSGFSCDSTNRSVLTAIQNKQFINTFAGTKCLKYCISSFYHFSQFKFPPSQVLRGPVPVSLKNPLSDKDIPSVPQSL